MSVIKSLVLLPGGLIVVATIGILVFRSRPVVGRVMVATSVLALYLTSTSWFAGTLAATIEQYAPLDLGDAALRDAAAIVILGGGAYQRAPEFAGDDEVSRTTLERLRYGAHVHRQLRLDIAVTGGRPRNSNLSEAESMKIALNRDFGVAARWVEDRSLNTEENALFTADTLGAGETVILVTHAVHMRRAAEVFERAGLRVIPAPMGFISGRGAGTVAADLLPSVAYLAQTNYALYEIIGGWWYRAKRLF